MKKALSLVLTLCILLSLCLVSHAESDIVLADQNTTFTRGGNLNLAINHAMTVGLDITKISDGSTEYAVMAQIYESLTQIGEDGTAVPGLATEWSTSDDGLTFTMKLREDVSFSNGEKFNAQAVEKCMSFYLTEECGHVKKGSDLKSIDSVKAIDEYTVAIQLNTPDAGLDTELAHFIGFIMAPSNVDNKDFATNPIGTGPFVLKEYKEGEYVILERNPNYYLIGADDQPLPYLDSVKFSFITDDTTRLLSLQSGEVDGTDLLSLTSNIMVAEADDGIFTLTNPVTKIPTMCANLHCEKLADVKVRQALCYAINQEEIVEVALEGYGTTGKFFSGPQNWFYCDYNPYTNDPEKAKALLAEAGVDNLSLELTIIAREPDNTIAQMIQSELSEVGVNIEINALDTASFVNKVRVERTHELAINICGNGGLDPSFAWSDMIKAIGGVDSGIEFVDKMSALIVDQKAADSFQKRCEMIREFQETTLNEGLYGVTGIIYRYAAFSNRVHDIKFQTYGWLLLKDCWIEK